jgi:hypothetical protein
MSMKKNKMMRLASALLVLTLLTTSVISGTFAKYTTSASASDTARVAKWGVTVSASGSLFSKNYLTSTNTGTAETTGISVASSSSDNLVAPGTKNDSGLTFSIKGKPEVAVKVKFDVTVDNDVFLKAIEANGAYKDYTNGASGTFTLASDYHPVLFTLKKGDDVASVKLKSTDSTETKLENVTLATLETGIEALSQDFVEPNTQLDATYTLTWKWDYDDASSSGSNDKADTLLGTLAATPGSLAKTADSTAVTVAWTALTKGSTGDYDTDIGLKLVITVEQAD